MIALLGVQKDKQRENRSLRSRYKWRQES